MPNCAQCHAEYHPEDLDAQHPICPVCQQPLFGIESDPELFETEVHDPFKGAPRIDGFEITRHIGRGGMGDVWEARQNVLGRKVAIKVLAANLSQSEHFLARFTREARTLARLQHPGIVNIYDFRSSSDGLCCIIMEYVEGPRGEPTTLYDLIQRKNLDSDRTRFIVLQVLHALQYAHEEGVIHRDIKPTNVLIDRYSRVKVVDFGIAAMPSDPSRKQLTYVGGPLGTAEYMAPEQTENATQADHRADLYALGVVIYELLTGFRPRGIFGMPSEVAAGVDLAWDDVVRRALQPNRDQRFANAREMIAAIQGIRVASTSQQYSELPAEFIPLSPNLISPTLEVDALDDLRDEFPSRKTPLPFSTPTAEHHSPDLLEPEPDTGDTEVHLEDDGEELPSWMVKRRQQANAVEETEAHLPEEASSALGEAADLGGGLGDSVLHLDQRQLSAADSSPSIPLAEAADLEDWLAAGPAPRGHDSSPLIEVDALRLPKTPEDKSKRKDEPADKASLETPDTSNVVPLPADDPLLEAAASNAVADQVSEPKPTGTLGALTTEEPDFAEEELPDGDFIELARYQGTETPTPGDKAIPYRPAHRSPTLKICVLDDASQRDGEWFRIRQPSFVIGRKEGDLILRSDRSISSRHAEILMQPEGTGLYEFLIRDLETTNGTFARASRATLDDGQEFLLGFRRYVLKLNRQDSPTGPRYDKLVELTAKGGPGKAFRLGRPPIIIGRNPLQCNLLILDDPFLSPVHAVLKRDHKDRWVIKNYNSRNGVWIRITEMKLISGGEFQIGAQRFVVQIP